MTSKSQLMFGMSVGALLGGYIPSFFGADIFSFWSIVGSLVGGLAGIYLVFKISQ